MEVNNLAVLSVTFFMFIHPDSRLIIDWEDKRFLIIYLYLHVKQNYLIRKFVQISPAPASSNIFNSC